MAVLIPKQSVPPIDSLADSDGNPVLFNKTWWLAFSDLASTASITASDVTQGVIQYA